MKIKYLNLAQAQAMCADYQYLTGQPYENDAENDFIAGVIVAPYSRILQWQFIRNVVKGMPVEEALLICKDGRYDVLVYPRTALSASKTGYRFMEMRSFLAQRAIGFDPQSYHCLRKL